MAPGDRDPIEVAAVLAEFFRRIRADLARGEVASLADYLARFPGHEATIAEEYAALTAGTGHDRVLGAYRLLRELGRGGQGAVYLAEDTRSGGHVAVKLLRDGVLPSLEQLARFHRESRIGASLDHPGICAVHDVGFRDGTAYLAMRYVAGRTLAQLLAERRRRGDGGLPPADAFALIEKAARAAHAAHEAGFVHRDLTPGNLMVGDDGEPVILDFGLARDLDAGVDVTASDDVYGTLAYMAPEQLAGTGVDRRADVWALGVSLYEALTLRHPFPAPTRMAQHQAIVRGAPMAPLGARLPADAGAVLAAALDPDVRRRYHSAAAFADDLRRLRTGQPVHARRRGHLAQVARWARRHPSRAVAAGLAVLLAGGVGYALARWPQIRADRLQVAELARIDRREQALEVGFASLGDLDDHSAAAAFESALAADPGSVEAVAGLALAHLAAHRPDRALAAVDDHAGDVAASQALRAIRADALRALGRDADADAIERQLGEPSTPLACFVAGSRALEQWHHQGRDAEARRQETLARARTLLERSVLLSGAKRPLFLYQLAHAIGHGDDVDRIEEIVAVIRSSFARPGDTAQAWQAIAYALWQVDRAGALQAVQAAVQAHPEARHLRTMLVRLQCLCGHTDEAAAEIERLARTDDPGLAALRALLARFTGRRDEEAAMLRAAIERCDRHPEQWLRLIDLELARRDLDAAEQALSTALQRWPEDAGFHRRRAMLCKARGDWAGAREALDRALARTGGAELHFDRGLARARSGDEDGAIADYLAAAAEDPQLLGPDYNLGVLFLRRQRHEDAIRHLRRHLELSPDHAEGHCNLGLALQGAGDLQEAVVHLRRGHALGAERGDWSYPSARWVAACEARLAAERRLDQVLAGGEPTDATEAAQLADLASQRGLHRCAAELWQAAFARAPRLAADLGRSARLAAVRSALATALGRTVDAGLLDAAARETWRDRARTWLGEHLGALGDAVRRGDMEADAVARVCRALDGDVVLRDLRGDDGWSQVSAAERERWQQLWRQVASLASAGR